MLEDENDIANSGDDIGSTQQMSDPPLEEQPKKEKKPGDWVTVEMPKASRSAAATKPPDVTPAPASSASGTVEPAAPPAGSAIDRTMLEAPDSSEASAPPPPPIIAPSAPPSSNPFDVAPGSSSAPMQPPASQGGVGGMLSNIGIKDPQSQKIAMIGGSAFFIFCCACPCVAFLGSTAMNMFAQ